MTGDILAMNKNASVYRGRQRLGWVHAMCEVTLDSRLFTVLFMVMYLMTCLGFAMGLYVYTIMDKRFTEEDNNMVNYAAPLDNAVAQFWIQMQQGLAAVSLQIALLERNLTRMGVRRERGY